LMDQKAIKDLLEIERFLQFNDIFMAKIRLRELISRLTN